MSAALRSVNGEIRVDMRSFNTFSEIKDQLEEKLRRIDANLLSLKEMQALLVYCGL